MGYATESSIDRIFWKQLHSASLVIYLGSENQELMIYHPAFLNKIAFECEVLWLKKENRCSLDAHRSQSRSRTVRSSFFRGASQTLLVSTT